MGWVKLAARSRLFYRASDPAIAAAIGLSMADLEKAAAGQLAPADWQISKLIALFNITRSRELIDD